MDANAEFRRGDFFDLQKLHGDDATTLAAVIRSYQYWIAISDCDGFRVDAAKHIPQHLCQRFSTAISSYAASIGKQNYRLVGEITDNLIASNTLSLLGSVFDRALTAGLDINNSPQQLAGAAQGTLDPRPFLGRSRLDADLNRCVQTGRIHGSELDDHDISCKARKECFAAGNITPHRHWQVAKPWRSSCSPPAFPAFATASSPTAAAKTATSARPSASAPSAASPPAAAISSPGSAYSPGSARPAGSVGCWISRVGQVWQRPGCSRLIRRLGGGGRSGGLRPPAGPPQAARSRPAGP